MAWPCCNHSGMNGVSKSGPGRLVAGVVSRRPSSLVALVLGTGERGGAGARNGATPLVRGVDDATLGAARTESSVLGAPDVRGASGASLTLECAPLGGAGSRRAGSSDPSRVVSIFGFTSWRCVRARHSHASASTMTAPETASTQRVTLRPTPRRAAGRSPSTSPPADGAPP